VWVTVFTPLLIMAFALVMERVEAPLAGRPVRRPAKRDYVSHIGRLRVAGPVTAGRLNARGAAFAPRAAGYLPPR
jgi:hypothetical protein